MAIIRYCVMVLFYISVILKQVLSDCDTGRINFTFPCGFDKCTIPGQFCDISDPDSLRCGICDIDLCNEGRVPDECKIPCQDLRPGHRTVTGCISSDDKIWNAGNSRVFFGVMCFSIACNVVLLVLLCCMKRQRRSVDFAEDAGSTSIIRQETEPHSSSETRL